MEQAYNAAMSMLQLMTAMQLPKQGGSGDQTASSDFSKLLEQKADAAKPSGSNKTAAASGQDAPASDKTNTAQDAGKQEQAEQPNYDVAQQLACAQMVWINVDAVPEQQMTVTNVDAVVPELDSTAVQTPMAAEAVQAPVLGEAVQSAVQTAEAQQGGQPDAQQAAEQLPQDGIRAVQPQATQTEAKDSGEAQLFEDAKVEVSVKRNDTEDKAAEEAPLFENVEAAPIKVAEAPAQTETVETAKADVETQVKEKLTQALENGESKVEIKLTPETLGSVKIEITQDHSGIMHIVINAESGQTRGLLEKHVSGLQSMLADRGYQTAQIEVREQQENRQTNERQDNFQDGRNGQGGQQQERRRQHAPRTEDFLQQLRLGLIPLEEVS